MPNQKISQFNINTNIGGDNLIPMAASGTTYAATVSGLTEYFTTFVSGYSGTDIYVTGGTYSNGTAVFTNNTGGTFTVSGFLTGGTSGTEVFVTGGTYSNGTAIFTNNTGGTFTVTGFYTGGTITNDTFVTGGTYTNGTATFTNNTGGTFNVSGFYTGSTELYLTGGTYSDGTATFTNNTGGTFNVNGFYTQNMKNYVTVGVSGNTDFTSIKAAVDSITDASTFNPYAVVIFPGVYFEDSITMKSGIHLFSFSLGEVLLIPNSTTQTIFVGADGSSITNIIMNGASGTGGRAIYHVGTGGTGFLVKDCNFNNNYINVECYGASSTSTVYVDRCSVTGNNTYGFIANNSGTTASQIIFVNSTYRDTTLPVTETFLSVSGTNSVITLTNTTLRTTSQSGSTCIKAYDGGEIRVVGSTIRGFETAIKSVAGGAAPKMLFDSVAIDETTNHLVIEHTGTTGYYNGVVDLNKVTLDNTTPFYIYSSDLREIHVAKKGEQFTSIADAVNFITDSSETNRYVIKVGAGEYTEPLIDLTDKPYISIVGSSIASVLVQPDSDSHHVFKIAATNEISFLTIKNAGLGYAGIYMLDGGDYAQAHKISFIDCDTGIYIESDAADSIFYGEYIDYNGTYSYGTKVYSANGNVAFANLENYYNLPTGTGTTIGNYIEGTGATITVLSSSNNGVDTSGSTCFEVRDGGEVNGSAIRITNYDYGIRVLNIGLPSTVNVAGTLIKDSGVYDMSFEHAQGRATYVGSASHTKINNQSPYSSWIFLDIDDSEFEIRNKLSITYNNGTHTDLSTLITETSTMGVFHGGVISIVSGLTVNVSSGFGYFEDAVNDTYNRNDWNSQNLTLPDNQANYVYFNENQILSYSTSEPDTVTNILLGRVVTHSGNTEIINATPLRAEHTSNNFAQLFRNAIGPVYASGSIVNENTTPFKLDVTSGTYYFSTNEFTPSGGTAITFTSIYRNGLGGHVFTTTDTVDASYFDNNNGTLSALTTNYYTKHSLYVVGEGDDEKYFLVYGQSQHDTLLGAENVGLNLPPSYFNSSVALIATIIVQQGNSNIIEILDNRPIIGFRSQGVSTAASTHGELFGLSADDHTQYLRVDGARQLSGNLGLGGNNIYSAGTINNVTIESHASRHQHGGADEVGVETPAPNAIPKANTNSKLDAWISTATTTTLGLVKLSQAPVNSASPVVLTQSDTRFQNAITGVTSINNVLTVTNVSGGTSSYIISDVYVTGGTYSNGTAIFTNSTGGTFNVSGFKTTDTFVTGGTYSNGATTFTNNSGGTFTVNGYYTGSTDVFTTGGTYTNGIATFMNNTGGTFSVSGFYTGSTDVYVTGGTYTNGTTTFINSTGGTFNVNGYYTGSTDVYVTGGTYTNGTATFTNSTGGTFNVSGFLTQAGDNTFITGGTYSNGTTTFTNNTGGTFTVTGYYTGNTDTYVTGGTYSNGTAIFTNSTGGTFNVSGFKTNDLYVTGGTYTNGTATFTNNTGGTFNISGFSTATTFTGGVVVNDTKFNNGISATTISATTYVNLPLSHTAGVGATPTASSTSTITHNLGRVPTTIRLNGKGSFTANASATPTPSSEGVWCSSGNFCIYQGYGAAVTTGVAAATSNTFAIAVYTGPGNFVTGVVQNVTSTSFDIVWTETGTATAQVFMWEAQ
jgi:YHS domain-containing protein